MKTRRFPLTLLLTATFLWPVSAFAKEQKVVFAAGCFWCMEEIFEELPGVTDVVSGYTGGEELNPTYEQVSAGKTGHSEAVEITYDDEKTSLEKLLSYFWKSHDSSIANGVAPDFGTQYRSELYYDNEETLKVMSDSKKAEAERMGKDVATQIVPFTVFWPAEDYHQDYARKNPNNSYVKNVSIPRLKRTLEE